MSADTETIYGRVQDDGTVKVYASKREAEKAGPPEALVVLSDDHRWIYPATGHAFKPEDVTGLSPATASKQATEALSRAHLVRAAGELYSTRTAGDRMIRTDLKVLKRAVGRGTVDLIMEVLEGLPMVVSSLREHEDEPEWNYTFLTIFRRRS